MFHVSRPAIARHIDWRVMPRMWDVWDVWDVHGHPLYFLELLFMKALFYESFYESVDIHYL
jgi:hypothetical protein